MTFQTLLYITTSIVVLWPLTHRHYMVMGL